MYLRKYLAKKLKVAKPEEIEILCKGTVVGPEYSLEFIRRTRWKESSKMVLEYRRQLIASILYLHIYPFVEIAAFSHSRIHLKGANSTFSVESIKGMLLVLMFCYGCVRGYYLDNPTSSSCPTCDMYLSAKPLTKILPDIPYFLSLGKLKAPNMLTQSHLQIRYLRKYLTKKLKVAKPDEITILCQGKVVGSEYTLEFIQRTLWKGSFKMILEYRRQRKPSMTIALANLRLLAPWLGDNFS
ncbi:Polycomb group RING finger protein 5-A [Phytophthora nicotianae]|uniref:Polycomb group RING finger protein 5-A n=1 Tax=Phytophthora nicotianae TaxID=4792 RepID=A0A0W8DWF4_PHYNI|nr:Polycomb group RING finger protein 5-A [Phytophthora nicotianae]